MHPFAALLDGTAESDRRNDRASRGGLTLAGILGDVAVSGLAEQSPEFGGRCAAGRHPIQLSVGPEQRFYRFMSTHLGTAL